MAELSPISLTWGQLYPRDDAHVGELYLTIEEWPTIQFFVGRNGSGKSRTARVIAEQLSDRRYLSTDRLFGLQGIGGGSHGFYEIGNLEGAPIREDAMQHAKALSQRSGLGSDTLVVLHEDPVVFLRVGALLRRAFGRKLTLVERAGYVDPMIEEGGQSYSLLRDEGHGLRELVILLAATYATDWRLLVAEEPELHLHPSLVRFWLAELAKECQATARSAIVVTHAPQLLRPRALDE